MSAALLVIDVQNDVVADIESGSETVAVISRLVARARAWGYPVVWVQHEEPGLEVGSRGWEIVPALEPAPGEVMIRKQHRSAFAGTGLAATLRAQGVDRVLLTGAQSAFCVDMAGKHALVEGFAVTLISDGHCNGAMRIADDELSDRQVRGLINTTWTTLRHPGVDVEVLASDELSWG